MKTNLTQAFLVLAMALILESCGGSQGGATSPREGSGSNPSQVIYTSLEIDLGNKIEGCLKTYEANLEEMKNQDIESPKLVAIGMTGHECLEIKDPKKLNKIHSEYKLHKDGFGKNWNLIARELLTKDKK
jgi:hypothetical protein